MTKLIAAIALAGLFVSPALAKSPALKHQQAASLQGLHMQADSPRAAPQVVLPNGRIIGQDPDPNVRLEILRAYQF